MEIWVRPRDLSERPLSERRDDRGRRHEQGSPSLSHLAGNRGSKSLRGLRAHWRSQSLDLALAKLTVRRTGDLATRCAQPHAGCSCPIQSICTVGYGISSCPRAGAGKLRSQGSWERRQPPRGRCQNEFPGKVQTGGLCSQSCRFRWQAAQGCRQKQLYGKMRERDLAWFASAVQSQGAGSP